MSLLTTTAISIATVLGTGILGLPVSLYEAGIWPFVFNFTITLLAQIGVVVAMTELLQLAYALSAKSAVSSVSPFTLLDHEYHPLGDDNFEHFESATAEDNGATFESPSLHTMSKLFLNHKALQLAFEGFVLLHFVSIMSSYALAAPQAYRQLIPAFGALSPRFSTGAFSIFASLLVIFLVPLVLPTLTWATFAKGGLLSVLIIITIWVGLQIRQPSTSSWGVAIVEPFLMGIMALSGVVNIMPVTFQACIASGSGNRSATLSRSSLLIIDVPLCWGFSFVTS